MSLGICYYLVIRCRVKNNLRSLKMEFVAAEDAIDLNGTLQRPDAMVEMGDANLSEGVRGYVKRLKNRDIDPIAGCYEFAQTESCLHCWRDFVSEATLLDGEKRKRRSSNDNDNDNDYDNGIQSQHHQ